MAQDGSSAQFAAANAGAAAVGGPLPTNSDDPIDFACPRCGQATSHRFYGPCPACMGALQAQYASDGREVEAAEYEPKMNVTPNAVALKE